MTLAVLYASGNGDPDIFSVEEKGLGMGGGRVHQAEMQFRLLIASAKFGLASALTGGTTKQGFEEIGEFALAKLAAAPLAKTAKVRSFAKIPFALPASSARGLPGLLKGFGVLPILSVLIVFFSFIGVTQYLVGFIDLLEFLIGLFVIGVEIGMKFPGEFAISRFYFVLGRIFIDAQYLVIIDEIHIRLSGEFRHFFAIPPH